MNTVYLKQGNNVAYYKIIDNRQLVRIEIDGHITEIHITSNKSIIASAINKHQQITKEEFDIVMNDAILKMIEISIL